MEASDERTPLAADAATKNAYISSIVPFVNFEWLCSIVPFVNFEWLYMRMAARQTNITPAKNENDARSQTLRRCLTFFDLFWFGVGKMFGAGIFVLLGAAAHVGKQSMMINYDCKTIVIYT